MLRLLSSRTKRRTGDGAQSSNVSLLRGEQGAQGLRR